MFFDTHAHYDDSAYDQDRETLLAGMPLKNVSLILNPGCDVPSSEAALRLAGRFPFVYAAAGIHPENLPEDPEMDLERIAELLKEEKCIAIGEIGLDYYWDKGDFPETAEARCRYRYARDHSRPGSPWRLYEHHTGFPGCPRSVPLLFRISGNGHGIAEEGMVPRI